MAIDLSRMSALVGQETMKRLHESHIAVIGVGGVGSWCAEALVRSGIGKITLVDDDVIASSNINRQAPALADTMGRSKVEVMRERLLEINPDCEIAAEQRRFTEFDESYRDFSVIVDAIDSVPEKAELILGATSSGVKIVSSMGAALRLDPTKVVIGRFDRVQGDGLARALRQRFKRMSRFPAAKFNCVYSIERPKPEIDCCGVRASYMPVTCAFGMALAAEVIKETYA